MRIVHVVESLAVGGLERVVLLLARWQVQNGCRVHIICLFHEGALTAEARACGIEVDALGKRRGADPKAWRALRSRLLALRPDVLHTHNAVAHYYAVAAAIGLGIESVLNTRHGMGSFPVSRKKESLYRLALMGTDHAVCVCDAAKNHFVQAGIIAHRKAAVVRNGVETARIAARSAQSRRRLLQQIGCAENTTLFGIVGRLNAAKDHATLLHAMVRVRARNSNVHLVVVGDGELRSSLEEMQASLGLCDSVHMLGMRNDVPQLLPGFDAFVLSSITEGYSLALVEAAAAALPIIATRVGGNAEIVVDGLTGFTVPPRDPEAMAAAIERLTADPSLRADMGARGRDRAMRHGTVEAMAAAYMALYVGNRPQTPRCASLAGSQRQLPCDF